MDKLNIKNVPTIVYSRSIDPRKLLIGIKYYTVHMYSMPYYTYGSTANFVFLGSTALIYNYIPYSAYISRVFNFANFASLESFAKLIQRIF